MTDKDFPFIVLNGPKVDDAVQRRVIRKQAMKDVGEARKRRGGYGRLNMIQVPSTQENTDVQIRNRRTVQSQGSTESSPCPGLTTGGSSDSSADGDLTDYDEVILRTESHAGKVVPVAALQDDRTFSLAAINLFSDYETVRAKFRIDLVDLSILTNFNVGKSTISILSTDPIRLAGLMEVRQWSYLQFVPSLYGSSEVVTAAANCLMAKAKATLSPHDQCKKVTLQLYAKALSSLQAAIANESSCIESDVLCATQLLSLHELLDPTRNAAWSHHVSGSARLIKHRGPHRFKTEFDKALFAAHVGQITSESLMSNSHCYLAEEKWSDLYRSLIQDSSFLHDRSSLTIGLRLMMFPLSGLWHDVDKMVTGPDLFEDSAMARLEIECRTAHRGFIDWMEDYKLHCVRLSFASPPSSELAMRRELFGSALECLTIIKRLLATVCDRERILLEHEIQAIAQLALDLQKQPSSKHSWLFAGHEVGVAYTTILTRDHWESELQYPSDFERRMAIRERYNTWNNTLRLEA